MRIEITNRPQRPKKDPFGGFGDRASGQFFSEFVTLPPGRYWARVQVVFSEKARGERLTLTARRAVDEEVLAKAMPKNYCFIS